MKNFNIKNELKFNDRYFELITQLIQNSSDIQEKNYVFSLMHKFSIEHLKKHSRLFKNIEFEKLTKDKRLKRKCKKHKCYKYQFQCLNFILKTNEYSANIRLCSPMKYFSEAIIKKKINKFFNNAKLTYIEIKKSKHVIYANGYNKSEKFIQYFPDLNNN
jgi:hypothetical protein